MNFSKFINNIAFNPYLLLLGIAILSLSPGNNFPEDNKISIPNLDKIIHFLMYFVLTFSILFKYSRKRIKKGKINIYILIFASSYGILMELLQNVMNLGRSASFYDFMANESGILMAFLLVKIKLR